MSAHLRPCYILRFSPLHFNLFESRHSKSQYLVFDVSAFREKKKHVLCQLLKHADDKSATSNSLARACTGVCTFLSLTASSMSSIRIHYNKVVIPFPRNSELEVSELTALFKAKELGIHVKFLQNGTWHNQYPDSFSQKFIVPTDVGDVYLVGIPEEDPKYENNNMNIVPQSPPVESLEFLSGGPTAAGGAPLMLSPDVNNTLVYSNISSSINRL